ncbi:MAG TPA: prepilin-type N-terminal cleavage/methylation domain-containing protein [Planctomycetota bacterium]|nr:prepilin-type N-terminal cleavage/methylation domain-containing protein [Planctomycetota bacterium]
MHYAKDIRRTDGRPARPAGQAGFTLIELLVVMAILASLAAILVPIVNAGRRMAKVTGTKSLLANTEMAITKFNNQCGYYPPDEIPSSAPAKKFSEDVVWSGFPGSSNSSEALYYCLANPYLVRGYSPFLELQAEKESADPDNDGLPEIVDFWGQPFSYNRKAFPADATLPNVFPGVTSLAGYDDGSGPVHNPDSYDLWSPGPVGYGGAEWISNWK